jgi:hypothetical protein
MKVLKIEAPDYPPMYLMNVNQLKDVDATLGEFLCLPGDESYLKPGWQVTITVVEMTPAEFSALPEWEM